MSRTMQLTVQVNAHYPQSFAASYPELARHLETIVPGLVGPDPTLLELCRRVDELLGRLQGTNLGQLLEARAPRLRRCQRGVEELMADWQLAKADKLLYEIEDELDGLEAELARG